MRWTCAGDRGLFERERPWLEAVLAGGRARLERRPGPDGSRLLYAKASPLRGRAAWRHAARRLAGLPLPRVAERANLDWLRANGFDAPRPVLAGAAWSGLLPRLQFLYTEEEADAETLEALLARGDPRAAPAALALARIAARLHARGFVHRDLFARNVLVRAQAAHPNGAAGAEPALVLLDAWRGGPRPGLRGPAYDAGCFLHDLERLARAPGAPEWLAVYRAERARLGVPPGRGFERGVRRARAQRARRDQRDRSGA